MFSKNKENPSPAPLSKNAIPSIIGNDVVIQGNITSQGLIQLDGKVEGEIHINSLTVGEQGWVDGTIEAQDLTIKGKVTGSIKAVKLTLDKTADVNGDIEHHAISVESGATINGTIKQIATSEKVTDIKNNKSNKKTG